MDKGPPPHSPGWTPRPAVWMVLLDFLGGQILKGLSALLNGIGYKLAQVGEILRLVAQIVARFPYVFKNADLTVQQMIRIGTSSLPLIIVISFFIGAVTAIQAAYQFRGFVPSTYIGTAVCKLVLIESGPVLTALVLAGRIGSAIAAEIGTMKEKEELDAMTVLNLDPLRYLAMPRLLSALMVFPLLVVIADFLSVIGGWIIANSVLQITTATYIFGLRFLFSGYDIFVSIVKAMAFGAIVAVMGYYHGLAAGAGARGVGQASMKSVVSSCVLILVVDFFIVYIAY
jgi:phospholipid/cholesterol/gamma-HCH transport system permease protein